MATSHFQEIGRLVTRSVVKVVATKKNGIFIGTGFLANYDGHVFTAWHVVKGSKKIEVIPESYNIPIPAKLDQHNSDDMAMISIDYKGLNEDYKVRFAPAEILPRHLHCGMGEEVGILGYAWGLKAKYGTALFVFKRIIAANLMHPKHSQGLFYYIDGTAIGGMSGGPGFTMDGKIAGIIVRIQPEKYIEFQSTKGNYLLPSPEHLTVALQSHYIHTALQNKGIYI